MMRNVYEYKECCVDALVTGKRKGVVCRGWREVLRVNLLARERSVLGRCSVSGGTVTQYQTQEPWHLDAWYTWKSPTKAVRGNGQ